MSIQVSRSAEITSLALDYRAARQDMIASNIANADTPFYRPRDISFEDALRAKKAEIFHDSSKELAMAETNERHLRSKKESHSQMPTTFFRDGHSRYRCREYRDEQKLCDV